MIRPKFILLLCLALAACVPPNATDGGDAADTVRPTDTADIARVDATDITTQPDTRDVVPLIDAVDVNDVPLLPDTADVPVIRDVVDVTPTDATDGATDAHDAGPADAGPADAAPVMLQILQLSDWHAQLDPLQVTTSACGGDAGTVPVGGAAALAAHFARDRAANPNTITLTGGDAFGASPPLAGFFEEQPAVRALNLMGLTADTFGNHNFDRSLTHLQAMIDLATYQHVSSNLGNLAANLMRVRAPFYNVTVGGLTVGIVGITNPDAPSLSFPGRLGTLAVQEPIAAAMSAAAASRAAGASIVVAVVHLGATGSDATMRPTGPLIDFATGVTGFAAILGDHTDFAVNTMINGAVVVENKSKGATYSRINLSVVPTTGMITARTVEIVTPCVAAVTPDAAVVAMLAPYRTMLAAANDARLATATATFPRGSNIERLQEVAIGNLLADAIRARYMTQLAIVNGGGIRAALPSTYAPADMTLRRPATGYAAGPAWDLVVGDVYAVLPFGNALVTRTVTGTQLYAVLERSVSMLPAAFGGFLQISGFRFTYRASAAPGSRVVAVTLAGGAAIARDATVYTLTTTDFTNAGGDGYTVLADGTGTTREVMADVVLDYIRTAATITPMTDGRITALP